MRGVGCIPHEHFHVSAASSPRRMATELKSSRCTTLFVVCYDGATRLPLLFPFEKNFSNRDGGRLLPVCPFVPLPQVLRNCLKSDGLCLIGPQCSSLEGAGLKPGIVEALEVELRAEEHEVVVVMIFVVAYKVLTKVSTEDVELMLGKEVMSARMFPMLLELAVKVLHERGVELVQREPVMQAPFA